MKNDHRFWEKQMDLLAQQDYIVVDDFFQPDQLNLLHHYFLKKFSEDCFKPAFIGPSDNEQKRLEIRNDTIYWLNKTVDTAISPVFNELQHLKDNFNRYLFLSLSDYEFHLAHYGKGSFYKKHLDQFIGRNNRLISVVIYLNKNWKKDDGGKLRLFIGNSFKDIAPIENRCVLFRSDALYHEVLPSNKSRKSLTGWMLYQKQLF